MIDCLLSLHTQAKKLHTANSKPGKCPPGASAHPPLDRQLTHRSMTSHHNQRPTWLQHPVALLQELHLIRHVLPLSSDQTRSKEASAKAYSEHLLL